MWYIDIRNYDRYLAFTWLQIYTISVYSSHRGRTIRSGAKSDDITLSYMQCPDTTWWRHQMETFSALLALCAGNSPRKGQWRGALIFFFICAWINGGVNNREAGDLGLHRAHYDVTVMSVATSCHYCNDFYQKPYAKMHLYRISACL